MRGRKTNNKDSGLSFRSEGEKVENDMKIGEYVCERPPGPAGGEIYLPVHGLGSNLPGVELSFFFKRSTNLVGVHASAGCVRQRRDVEAVRHQIFLGVHQVLQLLLVQEALEELAVAGAREPHAVVTLGTQKAAMCGF